MKPSRMAFIFILCGAVLACWGQEREVKQDKAKVSQSAAAEATAADDQKATPEDKELTRKIRDAFAADKTLPASVHNIKVSAQNGVVTLKGTVKSEDEKKMVIAKAVEVVGKAENVTDQLMVGPK